MFEFSSRLINITEQQPPTQLMEQLVFPILVSNLLALQLIFQCAKKKSKEKTTKQQQKPRNVVDKQENELQIRRSKKDGVVGTYDPNYQTLAGIDDHAFDPKPPADQGALAGTHDPNYQTLAAIDNNCFQKPNGAFPRPDGGFAIPPAKSQAAPPHPPAQLGMAQTHDPNYQTLAGIRRRVQEVNSRVVVFIRSINVPYNLQLGNNFRSSIQMSVAVDNKVLEV